MVIMNTTILRHHRFAQLQASIRGVLLGLALIVVLPACPHSTVVPTGDEVVNCAQEQATDIFHTLLPRVSTILASGSDLASVTTELAKLVSEYGVGVVTCVVDAVRDRNTASAEVASGDEKVLHERSASWAAQWLQEHGAEIQNE